LKWSRAFLLVTGFSYIGAAFLTVAGYPPEATVPPSFQLVLYVFLGILLMVMSVFKGRVDFINYPLAALYGVLAVTSFSGVQRWVNYNGSSDFLGVAMAAWDLAVAVALLDEVD
jgi:hypothetical protein